ncbi:MAG: S1/P1 nuclease [Pacificimonas sp.]
MTHFPFRLTLLALIISLVPLSPALAWGKTGHRVSGRIADAFLTTEARTAVASLIETESLAEASTWADFMRASPDPFWQREASPYHYVTVPDGMTYTEIGPPPEGDAVTALAKFRAQMLDTSLPTEQRALALRLVVHIVGDLHQPLHVGNGTDRGGNDVTVQFFGEPRNLHSVWDSSLIDREQLSYTEMSRWLLRGTDIDTVRTWWTADPLDWIAESAAVRPSLYPEDGVVRWDYAFEHDALLKRRLTQAGVRVAAYLNDAFGGEVERLSGGSGN